MSAGPNTTGDGAVAGSARTQTPVPQGAGVRGRITDKSGGPIELATITVTGSPSGAGPVPQAANVTDAEGQYFFPLPPGEWEITFTAHRYRPAISNVVVREGEPTIHDLGLEPADR
ncbi:MAG: carboxypeptidase regulatory-like domain-containing protein [Geodermatophilaceae bacterium]|nr:carboxypeptidase regulatory-like domain-containing protein [Geodermatophilaceae bacterium]